MGEGYLRPDQFLDHLTLIKMYQMFKRKKGDIHYFHMVTYLEEATP